MSAATTGLTFHILTMKHALSVHKDDVQSQISALNNAITKVSATTIPILHASFNKAMDDIKFVVEKLSAELRSAVDTVTKTPNQFLTAASTIKNQLEEKDGAMAMNVIAAKSAEVLQNNHLEGPEKLNMLQDLQTRASDIVRVDAECTLLAKQAMQETANALTSEITKTMEHFNQLVIGIMDANSRQLYPK